jgi:RNA polymerase sigma factor (sigma-70 family)
VSDSHERFERVFTDCYDAVHRYAARRVAPDAVQDVVSDTFLVAWRRRGELAGDPLPWLLGIARRTAANQRRGSARREGLQLRLRRERSPSMVTQIGNCDPQLGLALSTLADSDREALMLVAWDGLDHRSAATVMGCATGAFTVRLHRARRKLERALIAEEPHPLDATQEARSLP